MKRKIEIIPKKMFSKKTTYYIWDLHDYCTKQKNEKNP